MKLGHRIPVEPLDDERLVNIERAIVSGAADRLAAPLREPRPLFALLAAMCVAAAAGVVGWQLHGAPAPVTPLDPLDPPALALHTETEHSTIDIGDATIASDPATAFAITRPGGGVLVAIDRGRIELSVGKRGERPPLVVRAGDTDVEVVGTKFSVAYDGRTVDVRVREGTVKVTHQQQVTLVGAGREWLTGVGLVAETPVVATAPPPAPAPPVATIVTAPAPSTVIVAQQGHDARDHVATIPDAPAHTRVAIAPARTVSPRLGLEPGAHSVVLTTNPFVDLKVAIRKQPIEFDPKLDGNGDAATEIARLKKVAYSPTTLGGDASAALYRIAVLLHKPLKQDNEALRTLDIYRRRFARGRELDAALWLRVRILCGRAIDDDCRQAAYSYQQHAPAGASADVAVRITNSQ
jgi:hypothetical protein